MGEKIAGITDEAVISATDAGWTHWIELLDDHEGTDIDHKERVAVLADAGINSGWWQQQLAVGYEQERGIREIGETADAGYEIGVQRTFPVRSTSLWEFLIAESGIRTWLGDDHEGSLQPGETYAVADGTTGEIRTRKDGERIRLTYRPPERDSATTLQLTVSSSDSSDEKSVLRIHQEKLADSDEREKMRAHWKHVIARIESELHVE